jgi:hypothetical protein
LLKVKNGENASKEMINEHNRGGLSSDRVRKTKIELTELGKSVLVGEADFVALNGIDLWFGGTHLHDRTNIWRWDDQNQTLTHA